MRIGDIGCFCGETGNKTNTNDFLKESDYSDVKSSMKDYTASFSEINDSVGSLMNSGGLSAEALNFSGFSPLFEMGYQASNNADLAESSIDEVISCIDSDANAHMTAEWGTYYQKVNECTEKVRKKVENAETELANLQNAEKPNIVAIFSAQSKLAMLKISLESHELAAQNASKEYEAIPGAGSAADALKTDFTQVSTIDFNGASSTSNVDLKALTPENFSPEKKAWLEEHIDFIMDVCKEYGILPSVLIGQVIKENNMLSTDLVSNTNNVMSIRWFEGCGYENWNGWKKYDSIEDSIRDYAKLLTNEKSSTYAGYREGAKNWDYNQAIDGLQAYCSPPHPYLDDVKSIIGTYNLTKYDDILKNGGGTTTTTTAADNSGISSEYANILSISQANNRTAETVSVQAQPRTFNGGAVEAALEWGKSIADDNSYGYEWGGGRTANPSGYDCSSLAIAMYENAGVDCGGATYTGNMLENMPPTGNFEVLSYDPNNLQPGDILLHDPYGEDGHTEVYCGEGNTIGAHGNWDKTTGDSSGSEIDVSPNSGNWEYIIRYIGN